MGSRSYSFLDVAALAAVGPRLAAGDALVVLDTALETVLWANGAGARLFGATDPLSFIGADPALRGPVRRQIEATSGFPRIGQNRNLVLRLAGGLFSRTTAFSASEIAMPDGETAILFAAVPARVNEAGAIDGLSGDGQFAALLDGAGKVVAAADGFAGLGIEPETLARLAGDVRGEADRMVKRPLRAAAGMVPSGIVLLRDEPALSLLVVVDEAEEIEAPGTNDAGATPASAEPEPASPSEAAEAQAAAAGEATAETVSEPAREAHDRWYFNGPRPGEAGTAASDTGKTAPAEPPAASREAASLTPPAELSAVPVRFVWRTDAKGRFTALSDEFRAAFGAGAADVIGRRFADVSQVFGLDPGGEIAGLLERRDTWSGRSVLWPVTGTDLRVPVDLAALPVYGRDRDFEGFRGFGVARMGDAVVDPEAIGLALAGGGQAVADAGEPQAAAEDPFRGETPAIAVAPTPERRETDPDTDKVIRLAERRPAGARDLSAAEQNTFREIGERLRGAEAAAESKQPANDAGSREPVVPPAEPAATRVAEAPADPIEAADAAITELLAEQLAGAVPDEFLAREGGSDGNSEPAQHAAEFLEPPLGDEQQAATAQEDAAAAPQVEAPAEIAAGPADEVASEPTQVDLGAFAASTYDQVAGDAQSVPAEAAPETGAAVLSAADEILNAGHDDQPDPTGPFASMADMADAAAGIPALSAADEIIAAGPAEPGADATAPDEASAGIAESSGQDAAPPPALETPAAAEEAGAEPPAVDAEIARAEAPASEPAAALEAPEDPSADGAADSGPREALPEIRGVDTAVLSRLPLPIIIHRGDALFFANGEFLALTGYASIEELDLAGGLGALFGDPYRQGNDRKLRLRTRDGAELPVDAHLQSVAWQGGKALLLSLKPVREAAQATGGEDRDARLEELRTIIDTATDGVVLMESDGTIRSISRPAEALFGFEAEEVRGKPFATLFAIESQRAARDYLASLADNGVASVLNDGREVIGRESQGGFIPLFMTIGRLPKQSGYCAVVRDITQFKRTEEELTQARAQAERASSHKTDFLARVSHEIRTPLNAIIGFSELMLDEKFGPITNERYKDYLRDINRSGNHVLDLVNDLLDISKIEAGQLEMSYEAVSLNETLSDAVAMMQPQANRERVIIRSSFASKLPEVVADLRSIRQIALNLLSNAIRYTPAGGQVIVSTSYEPAGDILMRVRDTGIGMAAAEIEQALKPFKQINALKRPRGDGTGLGLPLTKAMVEANRARFAIQSTPGEGTLVEITFPSTRVLAH
jgi:PAS domain S-box-containing protein